jgi:hypothetical protein
MFIGLDEDERWHRPHGERELDQSGRKGASLHPHRSETLPDCLFLCGIVLLSVILYLPGLGFHSDDWHLLGALRTSPDCSLAGLYAVINEPITAMRPVQLAYLAALYHTFSLSPLGYHITNAAVLLCSTALLYLAARELQGRRARTRPSRVERKPSLNQTPFEPPTRAESDPRCRPQRLA